MCDCIETRNAELAPEGLILGTTYSLWGPVMAAAVHERRRHKMVYLIPASFCPFCGERYPDV